MIYTAWVLLNIDNRAVSLCQMALLWIKEEFSAESWEIFQSHSYYYNKNFPRIQVFKKTVLGIRKMF